MDELDDIARLSDYYFATHWNARGLLSGPTGNVDSYDGTPLGELLAVRPIPAVLDEQSVRALFRAWDEHNYLKQWETV